MTKNHDCSHIEHASIPTNIRKKTPKLVLAFNTSTDAMVFNEICNLGRIIPLPSKIRAGCGLAYSVSIEHESAVQELIKQHNIENYVMHTIEMYSTIS